MNQEDRILLEQLNEVISRNPRLQSYRLSLRSYQNQKHAMLRTWLVGFLFGAMTATAAIAFCHSTTIEKTDSTTSAHSTAPHTKSQHPTPQPGS
ncbi:hypothetical protein [Oscillatoria sp. FACHB-1406]|uniref:hypothetical protein n=1 Tax=Oscillatoria sp. FACHB-1406 TaxID=2692846 RepID=UPI0016885193|nr:hypothetical protein [Oscillatoria sp. FACHB-1406]MBD2580096.1 hypothetical protein [Oscillatoria sp. FACHB-1406]